MHEEKKNKTKRTPYAVAFGLMGELGIEIAVPVVLLAKAGQWLDGKYGTEPKLLIAGFVLSFLISASIIWKRAKHFQKMYENNEL